MVVTRNTGGDEPQIFPRQNSLDSSDDLKIEKKSVLDSNKTMTSSGRHLRLCVLGAKGVGKTAIIVRYLTRRFIGEYRSQINMSYCHQISFANQMVTIEIIDFSPKKEETQLPEAEVLSDADFFLVVFSVTDRQSFLKAVHIVTVLQSYASSSSIPIMLLGNKTDLDHFRQVSMEELEQCSCLLRCDCAEVSVAESSEEIFPVIFRLLGKILAHDSFKPCLKCRAEVKRNGCSLHFSGAIRIVREQKHNCKYRDNLEASNAHPFAQFGNHPASVDGCKICGQVHPYKTDKRTYSRATWSHSLHGLSATKMKPWYRYSLPGLNCSIVKSNSLNERDKDDNCILSWRKSRRFKKSKDRYLEKSEVKPPNITKNSKSSSCSLPCNNIRYEDHDQTFNCTNISFMNSANMRNASDLSLLSTGERLSLTSEEKPEEILNLKTPDTSRKSCAGKVYPNDPCCKTNFSQKKSFENLKSKDQKDREHQEQLQKHPNRGGKSGGALSNTDLPPKPFKSFNSSSFHGLDKMDKRHFDPFVPVRIPGKRERKIGVFGKVVFGTVFSKRSLPDLPKATANLYTKFDSLKRTIQKRSL